MVHMGVGEQNGGNLFVYSGRKYGLDMRRMYRARVKHNHLARADQIGAGAGEGERPAIVADNAPHKGRKLHKITRMLREAAVKGDVFAQFMCPVSIKSVFNQAEAIDIHQPFIGDFEMWNHGERQKSHLQKRFGQRHAQGFGRRAQPQQVLMHRLKG